MNFVVNLRAAQARGFESNSDSDAFHSGNRHHRGADSSVELAVP
jgi:hypothetical protein